MVGDFSNKVSARFVVSAAVVLAGFPLMASAFQPLVTDDTGTQGDGGNQLEFSFSRDRTSAAGESQRVLTVPVVYTRGLSETLDVFAGYSFARIHSSVAGEEASGSANPSVGAKWRFYENEASGTSLAVKPEFIFPVSAHREEAGLGAGRTSGNLTFILTQEVPFGAVHVNAGVGRERYRDTSANPDVTTRRFSVAPVWDVTEQWKLALDVGVESARAGGATVRSSFAEIGAVYSPDKALDFALGFARASDNDSPKSTTYTATAGVTWRFE